MPKHGLLVCSINTSIVINVRNYRNGLISLATRNYLINVTILRSRPRRESQNRAKKETREGKLCWNTSAKKNTIVVQNYRLYSTRPANWYNTDSGTGNSQQYREKYPTQNWSNRFFIVKSLRLSAISFSIADKYQQLRYVQWNFSLFGKSKLIVRFRRRKYSRTSIRR